MSSKVFLCALVLNAAFPLILSFHFASILETWYDIWMHLNTSNVYQLKILMPDEHYISLKDYTGIPMIITNLPFECDSSRIYVLNWLATQYYEKLVIIAFPSDEFSKLCPIDRFISNEVVTSWKEDYQMQFIVSHKVMINGLRTDPLWVYLRGADTIFFNRIVEDYTMFIINQFGKVVKRIPGNPFLSVKELEAIVSPYIV